MTMYPRSKNLKDGWSDSLSEIEREFDRERAKRAWARLRRIAKDSGLSVAEVRHLLKPRTQL